MTARAFWEAGHRVFGLHGVTNDSQCDCGLPSCTAILKHPRSSKWQNTPHWAEDQFNTLEKETGHLATGYGIVVRGLLVIDVDARNGGVESYANLIERVPAIAGAGLIVETGSGGGSKHLYFKIPEGVALLQHHADFLGVDFKSSGYVVGPGSLHSSGNRYVAVVGTPADIDDAPPELIELLRKPERHRAELADGSHIDVAHADIAEMLAVIDPDTDHETWVRCGMAAHHASGGTAFDIWDKWSNGGTKYPGRDKLERRWHSFGKSANPVTLGTLVHYAEQNGWKQSVEFTPTVDYSEEVVSGLPFDISDIDLKRPPGFVGTVAEWINDQCRRPREHLAVAGAITAMGNIIGLRYTDDLDGVTGNLFMFCVAGSRTGKEAILQSITELHKAVGIHIATHGSIKSEQELMRNLTRHQASYYVVDEIAHLLGKIKNAQTKGGAIYLDGVPGILMSAYSKANGFMLLTGDLKEETRRMIRQETQQIEKQLEEGNATRGLEARLAATYQQLQSIDNGLEKPVLSLIGFTTPVNFDVMVDYQSATNGFIGRSLIFNERETVPRAKKKFKPRKLPMPLEMTLKQLFLNGEVDQTGGSRVEYYGDRTVVPTTAKAAAMLEAVTEWFEDMAEEQKSITGLEALALGAYELVSKVSLVLAVPGGIRTEEHVRWSFALIKRDIEEKTRLVVSNDRAKDNPLMALRSKIANMIAGDEGETLGVICGRIRSKKKADIEHVLNEMVKAGIAIVIETYNRFNKRTTKRYKMI